MCVFLLSATCYAGPSKKVVVVVLETEQNFPAPVALLLKFEVVCLRKKIENLNEFEVIRQFSGILRKWFYQYDYIFIEEISKTSDSRKVSCFPCLDFASKDTKPSRFIPYIGKCLISENPLEQSSSVPRNVELFQKMLVQYFSPFSLTINISPTALGMDLVSRAALQFELDSAGGYFMVGPSRLSSVKGYSLYWCGPDVIQRGT